MHVLLHRDGDGQIRKSNADGNCLIFSKIDAVEMCTFCNLQKLKVASLLKSLPWRLCFMLSDAIFPAPEPPPFGV
jgi:hypothetical protein